MGRLAKRIRTFSARVVRRGLWQTVAFALVVTAAATGLIVTTDAIRASGRAQGELLELARDVRREVHVMSALEWQAIAERGVQRTAGHDRERNRNALWSLVERSLGLPRDAWSAGLERAVEAYVDAVDAQFDLLEHQRVAEAIALDRDVTDPAFDELLEVIEAAEAGRARAVRDTADLDRLLTILALASGILVSTGLFVLAARALRRAQAADRRAEVEFALRRAAYNDALTGLPSRSLFMERLEHALSRRGSTVAVGFLDVDDLKRVNDSLGHAAGDALLVEIARRLRRSFRSGDTVARIGGDEFSVLIEDATEAEAVVTLSRAMATFGESMEIAGRSLRISASAGVAFGATGDRGEDVVRRADIAMYRSKLAGKDRVTRFDPWMGDAARDRLDLEQDLRRAIEAGELTVHYQPIVGIAQARVVGLEALARWPHPTRGLVPPQEFIPLAEAAGLIAQLDRHVIFTACADLARWRLLGHDRLVVAVNVSIQELREGAILEDVRRALRSTGVPPSALCLEVTESVFASDLDAVAGRLKELRALGVSIAIDDFGTGYSSIGRFRDLPVDILKIDRTFIDGIALDPAAAQLVSTIARLAADLHATALAEGVERAEDAQRLAQLGCDLAQGFLWSRPVPSDEVDQLVAAIDAGGVGLPRKRAENVRLARRERTAASQTMA